MLFDSAAKIVKKFGVWSVESEFFFEVSRVSGVSKVSGVSSHSQGFGLGQGQKKIIFFRLQHKKMFVPLHAL